MSLLLCRVWWSHDVLHQMSDCFIICPCSHTSNLTELADRATDDIWTTSDGCGPCLSNIDHMVTSFLLMFAGQPTRERRGVCAGQQNQKQSRCLFDTLIVLLTFDWLLATGGTVANRDKVQQQAKTKAVLYNGIKMLWFPKVVGDSYLL